MRPDDLEIFVLTYNRSIYLQELLSCLVNQTLLGFKVVILDNASTDDTALVASKFKRFGYEFRSSCKNIGGSGNFQLAQDQATKEYVMILHDDDLIHPRYVENIIQLIDESPVYPALIASKMIFTPRPDLDLWKKSTFNKKVISCQSQLELATLLYDGFPLHFGSVVYKTSILKKISWNKKLYGKIADRPFLIDVSDHGLAFVFDYPYVQYRLHDDQDSSSQASGPFYNELLALHKLYFGILGWNIFKKAGRVFLRNIFSNIKNESKVVGISLFEYCKMAIHEGALSYFSLFFSAIFFLLQIPERSFRKVIEKIL